MVASTSQSSVIAPTRVKECLALHAPDGHLVPRPQLGEFAAVFQQALDEFAHVRVVGPTGPGRSRSATMVRLRSSRSASGAASRAPGSVNHCQAMLACSPVTLATRAAVQRLGQLVLGKHNVGVGADERRRVAHLVEGERQCRPHVLTSRRGRGRRGRPAGRGGRLRRQSAAGCAPARAASAATAGRPAPARACRSSPPHPRQLSDFLASQVLRCGGERREVVRRPRV